MFYIDFTVPDGKTYRIDASKIHIIYKCPVCGETSVYKFAPTNKDCCIPCYEQRKRQELEEFREQEERRYEEEFRQKWLRTHSAKLLNQVGKHKVTKIEKAK